VIDLSGGMSAICKPRVQMSSYADVNGWPLTRTIMDGRIMRCGIIRSCQSAATYEIVKRFWSRLM